MDQIVVYAHEDIDVWFRYRCESNAALNDVTLVLLTYPFSYATTLLQLGFQSEAKNLSFSHPYQTVPGIVPTVRLIRRIDGVLGLYRGASYKLVEAVTNGRIRSKTAHYLAEIQANSSNQDDHQKLVNMLIRETLSIFVSLVITYPLRVISVRVCAQFIGKETLYDSFHSAVNDIYSNGGIGTFYAGFVPKLLGECVFLWTSQMAIFVINKLLDASFGSTGERQAEPERRESERHLPNTSPYKILRSFFIPFAVNYTLSSHLYPFHLVSTIMSCNGYSAKSLEASRLIGKEYRNWIQCMSHLERANELKRGTTVFWRVIPDTRLRQ